MRWGVTKLAKTTAHLHCSVASSFKTSGFSSPVQHGFLWKHVVLGVCDLHFIQPNLLPLNYFGVSDASFKMRSKHGKRNLKGSFQCLHFQLIWLWTRVWGRYPILKNMCIHIYNLLWWYDWQSTLGGILPLKLHMPFPPQKISKSRMCNCRKFAIYI